jgi:AraC-like DNA-binding protein
LKAVYVESHPGAALSRAVECAWRHETAAAVDYSVRPDGCLDIIYSREMGLIAVGAMTVEGRYTMPAGTKTIGVRFRPGMARPFLRVSPAELTGKLVSLEDLWDSRARELARRMDDDFSEHTLTSMLIAPPAPDPVKRAIEAITEARGAIDLDWVASQAGMSPRQFRRRCFEESGLSPKHLCRILRFRHACQLAEEGNDGWAGIAAGAGYFDQAHLIRDFREFTGRAPMSVFSNRPALDSGHNRA